jgi:hypothetical protein
MYYIYIFVIYTTNYNSPSNQSSRSLCWLRFSTGTVQRNDQEAPGEAGQKTISDACIFEGEESYFPSKVKVSMVHDLCKIKNK